MSALSISHRAYIVDCMFHEPVILLIVPPCLLNLTDSAARCSRARTLWAMSAKQAQTGFSHKARAPRGFRLYPRILLDSARPLVYTTSGEAIEDSGEEGFGGIRALTLGFFSISSWCR